MRRLVIVIVALATLLPALAQAYDVLILQSRRNPAYDEVLKGFHNGTTASERVIVLSDYADVDVVRIVREDRPSLILAVGDAALNATRPVRQTPVLAVMALGIHNGNGSRRNLIGVGMFASPKQYLTLFKSIEARRIGVIHNPAKSGWYLHLARQAAAELGLELVVRNVSVPRDTITQLATLAGNVDALWMLPDSTAVTRETAEFYFSFGQQHNVPVVSFAAGYLGLGATAVCDIDRNALGRQAAAMADGILNGADITNQPARFPNGVKIKTNRTTFKHLGLIPD
ncbi:MAG TPA: ABC transporter substrate-binding protein [Desulfuromonadales bacterium]|nr:ABC transporter substrate-binding protein [Desulfuromonadales bacterium]